MNALIAGLAKERIERVDLRGPADRDLDNTAVRAPFLGKQQGVGGRVVGGAVDRAETGIAGCWIDRSQQCDAVRAAARHIEINACDVGEWRPVLMALEQEVTAIIKSRRGPA